jgi:hypothetical protein
MQEDNPMASRVTSTVQLTTANDGWFAYVDYGSQTQKLPIIAWALVRTESADGDSDETVEPVVIADDSQAILLSEYVAHEANAGVTFKLRHD